MSSFADLNKFKPTCPVIFFQRKIRPQDNEPTIFTIHCQKLDVNIECYVSTAIIKLEGEWQNQTKDTLDCVFALPTPGTVMNVTLQIGPDRVLTTAIISNDDAQQLINDNKHKHNSNAHSTAEQTSLIPEEQNPYEQYIPELFRLPFGNVRAGDVIKLKCEYLEPLRYQKRGYIVQIPLYFPAGTIMEDVPNSKIISIHCKINSLSQSTKVDCASHHIDKRVGGGGSHGSHSNNSHNGIDDAIEVRALRCKPVKASKLPHLDKFEKQHPMYATTDMFSAENAFYKTGRDFLLRYTVRDDTISAHCIHQRSNNLANGSNGSAMNKLFKNSSSDHSGTLCLMVTPPTTIGTTFGRAFFFLLDRSGSMVGEPYAEAIRAIHRALDRLRPSDVFNCCAFDHRQVYLTTTGHPASGSSASASASANNASEANCALIPATQQNVQLCKDWLPMYRPERGGTTMDVPIDQALAVLEESDLLPFLVLVTDGAVSNERAICLKVQALQQKQLRTRFLTLGIGSFCNWYFLKMLAKTGRGFSDVVVYREKIYEKIDELMSIANTPLLTDLEVGFQSKEIEIYPFPIPDLFLGRPIVISARYHKASQCPIKIPIRGFDPHGNIQHLTATVVTRDDLPVEKIFIKQEIDLMTADVWLNGSQKLQQRIVDISCRTNMPSAYTSTVMFETTLEALQEEEEKLREFELDYDDASQDDDNNNNNNNDSDERKSNRRRNRNGEYQVKREKILTKMKNNKKTVAAIAIGGTVAVVAVGLISFGDVGATMNNIPILGGGGDIFGGLDDGCCGECGGCGCGCKDGIGGCLENAFDDCGGDCDCDCDCGDCVVM